MILQCRAHIYIPWRTFQDRFFLLSRNMFAIRNHVFILPLFFCSLNKLFSLEGYLLPSSEIHEIPCNLHAQFSASIFSGIQNTFPTVALLVICAHVLASCKCMSMYICKRVRAQSSETLRNERTNERGKIVDSVGLTTFARQSDYSQLFMIGIVFANLNNLEVLFVLGLISDNLSIWNRIPFIILSYFAIIKFS